LSGLQSHAHVKEFMVSYTSLWSGMTSASSGAIALYPDFIGYGESTDWNRTYLSKEPYMQAAAVAWLDSNNQFNGDCITSELEDAVTVTGFSSGGYAAVNAAVALDQLGTEVLALYVIAAPLNLEVQIMHLVGTFVKYCCFDCFCFGRGRLTTSLFI
jgi:pimeloyl-ACP methyl ester carboxylesterase